MIITIDGPIATGKSSIAKKLASEIGFIYFDTGAMYRSITYALMKDNVNLDDIAAVTEYLNNKFDFDIKISRGERRYISNGEDISLAIRSPAVTSNVSKVSAIPAVREHMVSLQRQLAKGVNSIFEGRDMGTVVFPDADFKIYLTGNPEIRARRRYDELMQKFPEQMQNVTVDDILKQINERDEYDSKREISPLKKADDAYEVDTSDVDIDGAVFRILEIRDARKTHHPEEIDI